MTYSIKDWDLHYEKADTRKCKEMKWVAIPTDTADKKYRRIAKMKDGAEIFGMWLAIVEVASKMPVRGILSDNDGDLSCEDMELIGGFPASLYEKAIKRLSSPEIGWIIDENCPNLKENDLSGDYPDSVPIIQDAIHEDRDSLLTTGQDKTRHIMSVVTILNEILGTSFKPNSKSTQSHISARLSEGFTVEQFKEVIQTKYSQWHNDQKMKSFLRPETLFGTKFESYLNESKLIQKKPEKQNPLLDIEDHLANFQHFGYEGYLQRMKEQDQPIRLNLEGKLI